MKKYYKLLIIPCVIVVISLYFIGIDVINRTDRVDDPTQKAAEVAHYLYGVESDNGEDNGGETGNSEQNADNSASEPPRIRKAMNRRQMKIPIRPNLKTIRVR